MTRTGAVRTVAALVALWPLCGCRSEQAVRPEQASLPEAIDDWAGLLEADELAEASRRWCQDEQAAQQLAKWWDPLKRCHQQYDYRNWAAQAQDLKQPKQFTVGGHAYGHMHTVWEPTPQGWRIARVFICR